MIFYPTISLFTNGEGFDFEDFQFISEPVFIHKHCYEFIDLHNSCRMSLYYSWSNFDSSSTLYPSVFKRLLRP